MPFVPRRGRPGLLGLAARTAVVAGTATAVSGGMMAHQQKKSRTEFEAAQYEAAQQQMTRSSPAEIDVVAELQKLADLQARGVLSDAEFHAAKTRLLH